jgi:ATP-binding cassette subfamily C protein LapB
MPRPKKTKESSKADKEVSVSEKKKKDGSSSQKVKEASASLDLDEGIQDTRAKVDFTHWDMSSICHDDSLLGCLELMAQFHGFPTSGAALTAGLPLKNGRLSPDIVVRAAKRAYLSSRLVRKKLTDISPYTLPVSLLLKGDKACILAEILPDNRYKVLFPETGRGEVILEHDDLKSIYAGITIFFKPMYRYDQRSSNIHVNRPQQWFWGTLSKSWKLYSQVVLSAILVNIFAISSPLFTMNIYDRVVPNNAKETLWVLSIGIFIVFAFDFLLKTLRVYLVDTAGKKADILLASHLFEHVMGLELAVRPKSSGGFANELREFESVREFFSSATLVTLIDLPFTLVFVLVIYWISGPLAWVPLLTIPLVIGGAWAFHKPMSSWVRRTFREGAQKHALLVESINGIETIKTFGAEGKMQRAWEYYVAQSADSSKELRFMASLALNYSGFIQQVSYVVVIIYGVYLISDGSITTGTLIAASILSSRALMPLAQVVSLLTRFDQSIVALEALDKIIALPTERPPGKTFVHRPNLQGAIEFENVDFTYPDQHEKIFNNFSLKIAAGERIGLLGRIGSGKSTLEKMVMGLYAPEKGSLKVDGLDIRQIDPADLRNHIGYVPQDIYLFYGSVRENILFGSRDVDEEAFLVAAQVSGVYDFVRHHPLGFDMQVGEGGKQLSGGQRQAVSIARALVRTPSIFIMDEPTAMMDHNAEARLVARLSEYLNNKTFILITHRMPLLKLVSRLVVMDNGRVVSDGPKEQILDMLSNSQIRTTR